MDAPGRLELGASARGRVGPGGGHRAMMVVGRELWKRKSFALLSSLMQSWTNSSKVSEGVAFFLIFFNFFFK